MLRAFQTNPSRAADPARHRRHRFSPTLSEGASCLEERVLLSAAGKAHAAVGAANPAETRAGKEVTNLFGSILQTSPTAAKVSQLVHKLHDGLSVAALRKELTAEARARQGTGAPVDMTMIGGGQHTAATATTRLAAGQAMMSIQMMTGRSSPAGPDVVQRGLSQIPAGVRFAAPSGRAPSRTSGGGSPAATSSPATSSPASPTMSPMPPMTGMSPSSGMSSPGMGSTMSMMGSTASTAGSVSTIIAGIGTPAMTAPGSASTTVASIGTPAMLPISALPLSPLPVSPLPVSPLPMSPTPISPLPVVPTSSMTSGL